MASQAISLQSLSSVGRAWVIHLGQTAFLQRTCPQTACRYLDVKSKVPVATEKDLDGAQTPARPDGSHDWCPPGPRQLQGQQRQQHKQRKRRLTKEAPVHSTEPGLCRNWPMSLEAASSGQALHQRQAFSTMAAHMLQVAGWVGTKVSFIINSLDGAKLLPKAPLAHGLTVLRSTRCIRGAGCDSLCWVKLTTRVTASTTDAAHGCYVAVPRAGPTPGRAWPPSGRQLLCRVVAALSSAPQAMVLASHSHTLYQRCWL